MRLNKTAGGKVAVTLSHAEWLDMGRKGGWLKKAQLDPSAPPTSHTPPAPAPAGGTGAGAADPLGSDGGSDLGMPDGGSPTGDNEALKHQIIEAINSGAFARAKELMETLPDDSGMGLDGMDAGMGDGMSYPTGLGESHEPKPVPMLEDDLKQKSEPGDHVNQALGNDVLQGLGHKAPGSGMRQPAFANTLPSSRQVKKASSSQAAK